MHSVGVEAEAKALQQQRMKFIRAIENKKAVTRAKEEANAVAEAKAEGSVENTRRSL